MKTRNRTTFGGGRSKLSRNFGSRTVTYPARFLQVLQAAAKAKDIAAEGVYAQLLASTTRQDTENRQRTFLWLAEMVSATPTSDSAFGMNDPKKLATAKDEMGALSATDVGDAYNIYMNWLAAQMADKNSAVYRSYCDLRAKFGAPLPGYVTVH